MSLKRSSPYSAKRQKARDELRALLGKPPRAASAAGQGASQVTADGALSPPPPNNVMSEDMGEAP